MSTVQVLTENFSSSCVSMNLTEVRCDEKQTDSDLFAKPNEKYKLKLELGISFDKTGPPIFF